MSAAPKYQPKFPSDLGYAGLRMTADEFFGLGETTERYELIDGVVIMSPSPTPTHWKIVRLLIRALEAWDQSAELFAEIDLRLGPNVVYRPDLSVYAPGRLKSVPRRLETAPDLVVEVLSPDSKAIDLITKRADYEAFGVGEYWVFDPKLGTVRAWKCEDGKFVENPQAGLLLQSSTLRGFAFDLNPVWELRNTVV
jgi:Uma2 family endonuclease